MSLTEIAMSQFVDPFRIALLVGLVITMLRTQAATGTWLPLAAGALFVAVIIPATLRQADQTVPLPTAIGVGLVVNAVLLAIVMAVYAVYQRFSNRS